MNKWDRVCAGPDCPPYEIIYEDKSLLVCRKAPGIPVQSASVRTPDLEHMLTAYLCSRDENGQGRGKTPPVYLGVVHRLDQPVQGILAFAKTKCAAAALSRQIQNGQMQKEYRCVCRIDESGMEDTAFGTDREQTRAKAPGQSCVLTDYLQKDGRTNTAKVVPPGTKNAKKAVLSYEILERDKDLCVLQVKLFTGRHHQIRVQLAHAGLPILGDQKYGGPEQKGLLHLCACRLAFVHPDTGKPLVFSLEKEEENDE